MNNVINQIKHMQEDEFGLLRKKWGAGQGERWTI